MTNKFTIGTIVKNHFGVLNRVAGLFAKRCYNIYSLAVGETENPEFSRITIVVEGDDYVKDQIMKQLLKLHDVVSAMLLEDENAVLREHMLVKLGIKDGKYAELSDLINRYGGKMIDFSATTVTAEFAGYENPNTVFLEKVAKEFEILEVCRAGMIALAKGAETIKE